MVVNSVSRCNTLTLSSFQSAATSDLRNEEILMIRFLFFTVLISLQTSLTYGSWGDVDMTYQKCLRYCNPVRCDGRERVGTPLEQAAAAYEVPPPQVVPLPCVDLCKYGCIEETSKQRIQSGSGITKYYGHWPFIRYFGMEEPASVVFSVLNALPHMLHFLYFTLGSVSKPAESCYMKGWLAAYSVAACVCWFSSAYYHAKKTEASTHQDLITALGFITFGVFMAVRRIRGTSATPPRMAMLATAMVGAWAARAHFMLQGKVSFNSHMMLSIGLVILTTTLWVGWIVHTLLFVSDKREGRAKYLCLLCQVWLILASALEVFDFPPIAGVYDAHALWHAATIPLGFLWYRFWEEDRQTRCMNMAELNTVVKKE